MPGLVVFRRRWSVGSDDLVVPGAFLVITHFICFVIVLLSLIIFHYDTTVLSLKLLLYHQIGYVLILFISICVETAICIISMRGSILDSDSRATINLWIYLKSLLIVFDITWLVLGTLWLVYYYIDAPINEPKKIFIAIIICNWAVVFMTIVTIWCMFDAAGRSWVKMKKYQRSMRETESRFNYKRSSSMNRNWRQRKVMRAYQDSWDHRCRLLFCCMRSSDRNRNSFTDIARLLSDFFRELDVVPSDVVAGLVLLRKFQKLEREAIVRQRKNGTYEFLSGVPVTEDTQFLALTDAKNYDFFQTVIHYMYFAQGAYGWPMYFIINRSKMWHLIPELKCFGCCCGYRGSSTIIQDNCCYCNYAALKKTLQVGDVEIVYVTYHVDIGETPFFVAIDYTQKKVVISIRGTLSMKDILTDLNAEGEVLPLTPPRDDWLGHKGMVQAAIYIKNKLEEDNLIEKALNFNTDRNTNTFGLVLVGHSLGAGTAAILAILLKPAYPSLICFSYSPPGGLLSMPAVEYSKSFITSVVLGKDVVPRIGLHQMEALRADLINAIQRSVDPKWKTISCSVICCGCGPEPTSVVEMSSQDTHINRYQEERGTARSTSTHPTDSTIALTLHQPLYPPGRIIHIIRHHPKPDENVLKSNEPVYQAIWADSIDFDEVLISPVMLQDHMPDKVLAALKKVVTTSRFGPRKPQRQTSNAFSSISIDGNSGGGGGGAFMSESFHTGLTNANYDNGRKPLYNSSSNLTNSMISTSTTQHKVCLETSSTNLHYHHTMDLSSSAAYTNSIGGGLNSSKASSLVGSIFGRSQISSTQCDISSVVSVPSDAATVIVNEPDIFQPLVVPRFKAVAFDMETNSSNIVQSNLKHHIAEVNVLRRDYSVRLERKPKNVMQSSLRRASDVPNQFDLLQDDWLGLAPLASPETLSEISSISSRSAPMSLANSIERFTLQNITNYENNNKTVLEDIFESQLHTPKILRRAPKFSEHLSSCADDSKNLDQYKRLGRVFVTFPRIFANQKTSVDSSDDSFESAQSLDKIQKETQSNSESLVINSSLHQQKSSSKSADQLDDESYPKENPIKKLTFSDSEILGDGLLSSNRDGGGAVNNNNHTGSADTTYYSANSSFEQFYTPAKTISFTNKETHNNTNKYALRPGVLESHFPLYESEAIEIADNNSEKRDVVGGRVRKRLSSEEFIFSCKLPVQNSPPATTDRKRKDCIYPAGKSIQQLTRANFLSEPQKKIYNSNNESNV